MSNDKSSEIPLEISNSKPEKESVKKTVKFSQIVEMLV